LSPIDYWGADDVGHDKNIGEHDGGIEIEAPDRLQSATMKRKRELEPQRSRNSAMVHSSILGGSAGAAQLI
jgi:hypothetical protein